MAPPTSARNDYEATLGGLREFRQRLNAGAFANVRFREWGHKPDLTGGAKVWGTNVERTWVVVENFAEQVRSGKSHAPRKRKEPAGKKDDEDEEESRPSTSAPKGRFLDPRLATVALRFPVRVKLPGGATADLPKGRFARLLLRLLCSQFGLECEQEADRPAEWPKEWALPSLNTKHSFDYFLPDRYTPENLKFIEAGLGDDLFHPQWKEDRKGMLGELGFCNNFLEDCFFVYRRELLPFVARVDVQFERRFCFAYRKAQQRLRAEFGFHLNRTDTITRKRRRNRGLRDAAARKYDRTPFLHDTGKLQLRFTGNSVAFFTQEVHRDDDFRTVFHGEQAATSDCEQPPPACEMPLCSSSLLLQAFDGACELENESGRTYNAEQLNTTINDANEESKLTASQLSTSSFGTALNRTDLHTRSQPNLSMNAPELSASRANFFDPQFVEPRNELERNPAAEREINEMISCLLSDRELRAEGWSRALIAQLRQRQLRAIGVYSGLHEMPEGVGELSDLLNAQMFASPRLSHAGRNPDVWTRSSGELPAAAAYFTDLVQYATVCSTKLVVVDEKTAHELLDEDPQLKANGSSQTTRKMREKNKNAECPMVCPKLVENTILGLPVEPPKVGKRGGKKANELLVAQRKFVQPPHVFVGEAFAPKHTADAIKDKQIKREVVDVLDPNDRIHKVPEDLEEFEDSQLGPPPPPPADAAEDELPGDLEDDDEEEATDRRVRRYLSKEARMRKLAALKRRWKAEEFDAELERVFAGRPVDQFIVCKRSARILDSTAARPRASLWESPPLVPNGYPQDVPLAAIPNGRLKRAESSVISDEFVGGERPFEPSIQRPHENGYAMEDDYEQEDGDAGEQPEGHLGLDMLLDMMDQTAESNLFDDLNAAPPSPSPPIEETPPVEQETSTYNLRRKRRKHEGRDRSASPDIELFESKAPKRPPPKRSFRDCLRCDPGEKAPVERSDEFTMEHFDFTMAVSVPNKSDFIPRIRGLLDVTEKFNSNLPALPPQLKHLRAHTQEIRMTDVFAFARKKTANPEPDDPEREIVRLSAMPPRSFPDRPYVDVRSHLKAFTRPWPGIVVDPQFVRKQRLEEKERQDRMRAGLMLPPPLPGQYAGNDFDYTPAYDRKNGRKRRRGSQGKKRKSRGSGGSPDDDQASLPDAASTIFDPDDLSEPERSVMVVRSGTVRHTITRERFLEVDKIKNAFVTILFNRRLGVKSFERVMNVLKDYVRMTVESKEERPLKLQELLKNPTNALKICIEDERLEPTVRVANQKKLERITAELQKSREAPLRANSKAKALLKDKDGQAAKTIPLHGIHSLTSLLFFGKAIISGPTMHELNSTTAMPLMLSLCCEHNYVCVDTNEGDENTAGRADHMIFMNEDPKKRPKAVQIAG
ncbi:hypothetical protein M3Y99_01996400 [Aphelenchoides fujianensis]|nr:hypothetical protein M3Y99_01996400 [Aphelenchoides fujianensis]